MTELPDILREILAHKREEVIERALQRPIREVAGQAETAPAPRGFMSALEARTAAGGAAVIAEIKRASPSKGILRGDFDPAAIARSYAAGGAACLSVLTDEHYFQGADEHLQSARAVSGLPVIRKDFIIDEYQVYEARALGADCVLLIVASLGDAQLTQLAGLASHLGMDVLVEVHDRSELDRALALGAPLVGINNRDLRRFETTIETTLRLCEHVPAGHFLVTESGIHTAEDVARLWQAGIGGFLVGEAFMRAADPGARLAELFGSITRTAEDADESAG